jgi:hypothetical protein
MKGSSSVSIKELHARTGLHVRRSVKGPINVTDRGKVIAVIADPTLVSERKRRRSLLPEYNALLRGRAGDDVLDDLDAVRDR